MSTRIIFQYVFNFINILLAEITLNLPTYTVSSLGVTSTVCFTDLDQGSGNIIFQSILTTFIARVIFRGHWGRSKNCLELKIKQP